MNTGLPCVFIRTSNCNLYCYWCDTDYTWNFTGTPFEHRSNQKIIKQKVQVNLSPPEVAKLAVQHQVPHYVITGGEPLLQQTDIIHLIDEIKKTQPNAFFEIETNGTFLPVEQLQQRVNQFNVSVKLKNSTVDESKRIKGKAIKFFANSGKSNFKFVITSKHDLKEIFGLVKEFNITSNKIYLLPEACTRTQLEAKQLEVMDACLEHGFNYSDRLHIRLFDSKKGV